VTDKSEIVNKFNAYFTNIGSNLAKNVKYKGIRGHIYYLNKIVESKFTFKYVEEDVIKRTIIYLTNKSSYGYDGLSTKLLIILEPALTKFLALLTNQVLPTGIFPDKLKIAKVIPVYKNESKRYLVIIDQYHFYQLFQKYWKMILLKQLNCLTFSFTPTIQLYQYTKNVQ
jgi:hypothetical protein